MTEPPRPAPAGVAAPGGAVAAALRDVADLGMFFAVRVGGPDAGWHPVRDAYARGYDDLVTATAARYGTAELRVGASLVQLSHAARLWSPVLACAVLHGVVPSLTDLQRADDGMALRLPTASGTYAPDGPALAAKLYDTVVRGQLDVLAAGLRVKVAPRLLAGNAASALVGSARVLLTARPALRTPLTALTAELLATGRLAGTGGVTGPGPVFRRRSCCLLYRTPSGGTCGDCPLT